MEDEILDEIRQNLASWRKSIPLNKKAKIDSMKTDDTRVLLKMIEFLLSKHDALKTELTAERKHVSELLDELGSERQALINLIDEAQIQINERIQLEQQLAIEQTDVGILRMALKAVQKDCVEGQDVYMVSEMTEDLIIKALALRYGKHTVDVIEEDRIHYYAADIYNRCKKWSVKELKKILRDSALYKALSINR